MKTCGWLEGVMWRRGGWRWRERTDRGGQSVMIPGDYPTHRSCAECSVTSKITFISGLSYVFLWWVFILFSVIFSTSHSSPVNSLALIGPDLYGNSTSEIYLDDVKCRGNESSILDCPAIKVNHDCDLDEPASVSCLRAIPTPIPGGNLSITFTMSPWTLTGFNVVSTNVTRDCWFHGWSQLCFQLHNLS